MGHLDPIGFIYMADAYCVSCTAKDFTFDANHPWPVAGSTDAEGNEPHPIAPWETGEWSADGLWCGSCGAVIVERWFDVPQLRNEWGERGSNAAEWVTLDEQSAARIIAGYDDGDPAVMDIQPAPFSGEFAGESLNELFDGAAPSDDVLDELEQEFSESFWYTLIIRCHSYVDADVSDANEVQR